MSEKVDGSPATVASPLLEGIRMVGGKRRAAGVGAADTAFQPALFQGVDTVENVPLDVAVTGSKAVERYPDGTSVTGGTSWSSYSAATTYEELCSSLQVSAKATAAFGATGSATAKMKFARNFKMTTYCVAAVAYARRCEQVEQATAYGFLDENTFDLLNDDPGGFAKVHGDSWVNAVEQGGEYYAVYMFYCQSAEQQSEVAAKFKGEGCGSSASFKMAVDSAQSAHVAEVRFDQQVSGDPSVPIPTSPDDIAEYAHLFPSLTMNKPVVFEHSALGYERTTYDGRVPSSFGRVAHNRETLVGAGSSYAQQLADLDTIISQCNSLVGTGSDNGGMPGIYRFYGYADGDVADALAQAEADRKTILGWFEQYEDDPAGVIPSPSSLKSLERGAPALRVGYQARDLAGTTGHGSYFSDLGQDGLGDYYCNNHRRVTKIATYNNDDGIGLLETTYHDPAATATGNASPTYRRGSTKYTTNVSHQFEEDEPITRIELYSTDRRMHDGKHWTCVTGIKVYTGENGKLALRSSSGFYDKCDITTYSFGLQADGTRTVFIGWDGYAADTHVYGLRPIQAVLKPAAWPDRK